MNILYYIPNLSQTGGGVRQYACALLRIMGQDSTNRYFILHNENDPLVLSIIEQYTNLTLIPPAVGQERWYEKAIGNGGKALKLLLEMNHSPRKVPIRTFLERLRKRYRIDIIHCPYPFTLYTKAKTVTTLHDVQELHFPEFFSPALRAERAIYYKNVTELSTRILVSYQHVKQDLIKYFGRTEANVQVCLLDMQNLWFDKYLNTPIEDEAARIVQSLPEGYVFYPAATWVHKNHLGLLEALARLRDRQGLRIPFVSTGHQNEHYPIIRERIGALGLEDQVHFLGIVSDATLYALYQKARAVAVPTRYEAGSFPLMESILMGVPVICSSVTSLPETMGNDAFVFAPDDYDDLAEKLQRIVQDDTYRQLNLKNSRQQADRLKNTGALQVIRNVYQQLAS